MSKNIAFFEGFVTHVPTECLIEDYQMAQRARNFLSSSAFAETPEIKDALNELGTLLECMAETLTSHTESPSAAPDFTPSTSSIIALGYRKGIIGHADDTDIQCAAGKNVSDAMYNGCVQCENCEYLDKGECNPSRGEFLLEEGILYDGSVDAVDAVMNTFMTEN